MDQILQMVVNQDELSKITEEFKENRSNKYLNQQFEDMSKRISSDGMKVGTEELMKYWAEGLNREAFGGGVYVCDDSKYDHNVSCTRCIFYDGKIGSCSENNVKSAVDRLRNPNHRTPRFSPKGMTRI
jgi:hypothetical protein